MNNDTENTIEAWMANHTKTALKGIVSLECLLRAWQERNGGDEHFTEDKCCDKVDEEYNEWGDADPYRDQEETADIIIACMNYMIVAHGSLDPLFDKLQVVLARTDQRERDKERGIG